MKLFGKIDGVKVAGPRVFRLREDATAIDSERELILLDTEAEGDLFEGRTLCRKSNGRNETPVLPTELHYLSDGDIIRIDPSGHIAVLYRKNSPHNSLFVTERCNSKCLMCSQPPKAIDDSYLIDEWLQAIPLMSPDTQELGITGGEPTLLFEGLLKLIQQTKSSLPQTSLHMLSNGRLLAYMRYAEALAKIEHPDFMIGIPVYSDSSEVHDFVVQADGAFDQTIRGILNLGRFNQKVEIRFVIHEQTYRGLPDFARFVARNLPFVNHVALMGLEITGYTRSNLDALWIDPIDYQKELHQAVEILDTAGLTVSIYNLPLCLLPQHIWRFARKSISDWKNIYFEECNGCSVKENCGGFFASSTLKRSNNIKAIPTKPLCGRGDLLDVQPLILKHP